MYCDGLRIRRTTRKDITAVATVQAEAFGRADEAELTVQLINGPQRTISLVAESADGRPVGHILFSELDGPLPSMALAPLGVIPACRELQIGTRLVKAGLRQVRDAGYAAVFVLGEQGYYQRFGFSSDLADAFEVGWQGPHFMALELVPGTLSGRSGRLIYPAAFFAED